MSVFHCGPRDPAPAGATVINTTSRSDTWSRGLSPFYLGPINLYNGYISQNFENAWQYLKLHPRYAMNPEDPQSDPSPEYFRWAINGWNSKRAERYPMGKTAKPFCSFWAGQKLGYIEARLKIYAPLYARAVVQTEAYRTLQEEHANSDEIWLWDFDTQPLNGRSYEEVANDSTLKMGHGYILGALLTNNRFWDNSLVG